MGKRDWKIKIPELGSVVKIGDDVTWAIVERLEALVAIGDALEEVSDLWANTLAFGGQPVGEMNPAEAFEKVKPWVCDYSSSEPCVLMKGHNGPCVSPQPKRCQCANPSFNTGFNASNVCAKCGFSKEGIDAASS